MYLSSIRKAKSRGILVRKRKPINSIIREGIEIFKKFLFSGLPHKHPRKNKWDIQFYQFRGTSSGFREMHRHRLLSNLQYDTLYARCLNYRNLETLERIPEWKLSWCGKSYYRIVRIVKSSDLSLKAEFMMEQLPNGRSRMKILSKSNLFVLFPEARPPITVLKKSNKEN
jgi:hypothetical protein